MRQTVLHFFQMLQAISKIFLPTPQRFRWQIFVQDDWDFFFYFNIFSKNMFKKLSPFGGGKKKMCSFFTMSAVCEKLNNNNKKIANPGWKAPSLRSNLGGEHGCTKIHFARKCHSRFYFKSFPHCRSGYWNTLYVTLCWSSRCHKVDLVLSIIRVLRGNEEEVNRQEKTFYSERDSLFLGRVFRDKITCPKIKRFTISDVVQYSRRDITFKIR